MDMVVGDLFFDRSIRYSYIHVANNVHGITFVDIRWQRLDEFVAVRHERGIIRENFIGMMSLIGLISVY